MVNILLKWLYSYAGNTEISERWQVLKEDTSRNKLTPFIANWKTVATSLFLSVLPSNMAREMSGLPLPATHTHTSYLILKHRNISCFSFLRNIETFDRFFTNKKIYIFIYVNYAGLISFFPSLNIFVTSFGILE